VDAAVSASAAVMRLLIVAGHVPCCPGGGAARARPGDGGADGRPGPRRHQPGPPCGPVEDG